MSFPPSLVWAARRGPPGPRRGIWGAEGPVIVDDFPDPSRVVLHAEHHEPSGSVSGETKFRAEPRGPAGPYTPAGYILGSRRPVLSLRDQGAAPPLRLGVLALPGDGGHLTDFVANLWSIGAGNRYYP